jgi:hypothetical protein
MAIVRICSLEDLDDLAALVAELRSQRSGNAVTVAPKKNVELGPAVTMASAVNSIGSIPPLDKPQENGALGGATLRLETAPLAAAEGRVDGESVRSNTSSHSPLPTGEGFENESENGTPISGGSVLEQFRHALAGAAQGPASESSPPRVSLRQQKAEIEQQPFVRKAMDLFEVAPGQLRYSPPDS